MWSKWWTVLWRWAILCTWQLSYIRNIKNCSAVMADKLLWLHSLVLARLHQISLPPLLQLSKPQPLIQQPSGPSIQMITTMTITWAQMVSVMMSMIEGWMLHIHEFEVPINTSGSINIQYNNCVLCGKLSFCTASSELSVEAWLRESGCAVIHYQFLGVCTKYYSIVHCLGYYQVWLAD